LRVKRTAKQVGTWVRETGLKRLRKTSVAREILALSG
jgi:hypothetical protein